MKTHTLPSGKVVNVAEPGDTGPGIIRLAANFAHDMAQIAIGAAHGAPIFSASTDRQAHLAICRANSCGHYNPTMDRCLHPNCGCFCAAKTIFHVLRCPTGLW